MEGVLGGVSVEVCEAVAEGEAVPVLLGVMERVGQGVRLIDVVGQLVSEPLRAWKK